MQKKKDFASTIAISRNRKLIFQNKGVIINKSSLAETNRWRTKHWHWRIKSAKYLRNEIGHYFRDQDPVSLKWIVISSRRSRARLLPTRVSVSPAHTILGRSVGDDNATIAIRISTGGSITFSAVYTLILYSVSGRSVIYAEAARYHSEEKVDINAFLQW